MNTTTTTPKRKRRYHPYERDTPRKRSKRRSKNPYTMQQPESESDESDEPTVVDDPVQTKQKEGIKKILSTATLERKSPYHTDRGEHHHDNPIAPVEGTEPSYDWSKSLGRAVQDTNPAYAQSLMGQEPNKKSTWKDTLWKGGKMVALPIALSMLRKYLEPRQHQPGQY